MLNNIILQTDSYKLTHWKMYPPNTTKVHSYLEARTGAEYGDTVFFGLQYLIKRHLEGRKVSLSHVNEARKFSYDHFGKDLLNFQGWINVLRNHDGKLPVEIKAVPEGSVVPIGTPLMTIENTDPDCAWLTNHLETLLVQLWYPITVATISREMKKWINGYLEHTGDPAGLPFKLHDFGYRGSTSSESAAIGGAAHLTNFVGTDTLAGAAMLMEYYGADMPGFSVPAAEHSTITAWGRSAEADAYRNILEQYPTGIVSVVSDFVERARSLQGDLGQGAQGSGDRTRRRFSRPTRLRQPGPCHSGLSRTPW